jgi:pimeloyl-ACP methyl ester carboxylesterase
MFEKMRLDVVDAKKGDPTLPYVCYVENKLSPDLLVYFGNYNGHARGISTIRSLDCNALVMRSDEATWYLQEFAHGKTPEKAVEALDEFIKSKPHIKNVVFAGFSMGAFGALLYSTYSKTVQKVVATSPQVDFPTFLVSGKNHKVPKGFEEYASIPALWEKLGPPQAEIILQACTKLWVKEEYKDYEECLALSKFDGVKIKTFDCEGHNGISYVLLNDLDYYNNLFLYRPNLES